MRLGKQRDGSSPPQTTHQRYKPAAKAGLPYDSMKKRPLLAENRQKKNMSTSAKANPTHFTYCSLNYSALSMITDIGVIWKTLCGRKASGFHERLILFERVTKMYSPHYINNERILLTGSPTAPEMHCRCFRRAFKPPTLKLE